MRAMVNSDEDDKLLQGNPQNRMSIALWRGSVLGITFLRKPAGGSCEHRQLPGSATTARRVVVELLRLLRLPWRHAPVRAPATLGDTGGYGATKLRKARTQIQPA